MPSCCPGLKGSLSPPACWLLQEVAAQAEQASTALKAERRRSQAAEKQVKAAMEAKAEASAAAAAAVEELGASQGEVERIRRLAEERVGLVVQAENAAVEAQQQCHAQVRQNCAPLAAGV